MNWAIHSFGVASNALQQEAIERLQELRHKSKLSSTSVPANERADDSTKASAETSVPANERADDSTETSSLHDHPECGAKEPTLQQKADAHRQSMMDMSLWSPDYSDVIKPTASDIQELLEKSGIIDNKNLKDDRDNVIDWFANQLLTDNWPLVDGVLRQAGPTKMRIEHTDVVNKPGYRINHPEKLAAIQFIIKDLLDLSAGFP